MRCSFSMYGDDSVDDNNNSTLMIITVKRQLQRISPPSSCVLGQVICLCCNGYLRGAVRLIVSASLHDYVKLRGI